MALATYHDAGSVSVNAGQTTLTFTGASLVSNGIEAGAYFFANGLMMPLASVGGQNAATLVSGWPGASISDGDYFIVPAREGVVVALAARQALSLLTSGNVSSLSALDLAANKAFHATGAGQVALHDQTAHGRAIQALTGGSGKFVRSTGAGSAVMQDIVGTVTQSGGVPTGALVERGSNANGQYTRFADGTQICFHQLQATYLTPARITASWALPAAFVNTNYSVLITPGLRNPSNTEEGLTIPKMAECIAVNAARNNVNQNVELLSNGGLFVSGDFVWLYLVATGRWF